MKSWLELVRENRTYAHVVPFAAFLILNLLMQIANESGLKWEHEEAIWWMRWPEQWMYPLQTLIVGGLIVFFWKHYELKSGKGLLLGAVMGVVGIGIWLAPTTFYDHGGYDEGSVGWLKHLGVMPRTDGFDPSVLRELFGGAGVWSSTILRFLRAVVVVAFVEEIFWRGFLMRFILDPDRNYWKIAFGRVHWKSYVVVTVAFMLVHAPVDYFGAFFFGSLMYWVAVKTKSLWACVVMHGVANLLMGIYALHYGKFGLW